MGTMVEESIQKAIEALLKQDTELAQTVMDSDALVDQKQKEIESICFKLLMQQQPVAPHSGWSAQLKGTVHCMWRA